MTPTKSMKYEDRPEAGVFEEFGPEHTQFMENQKSNAKKLPKHLSDEIVEWLTANVESPVNLPELFKKAFPAQEMTEGKVNPNDTRNVDYDERD